MTVYAVIEHVIGEQSQLLSVYTHPGDAQNWIEKWSCKTDYRVTYSVNAREVKQ